MRPRPRSSSATLLAGVLAGGLALAAPPVAAQQAAPKDRLDRVEGALDTQRREAETLAEDRETLRRDVDALNDRLISAAAAAQRRESETLALEDEIATLDRRIATANEALAAQREELADLLAALARIARMPPEAALLQPGAPLDGVRSALLLRRAVPELERRAARLQGELESLAELRAERRRQRETMAVVIAQLDTERNRLDSLVGEKKTLLASNASALAAARRHADTLASEAGSLREMMAEIEAARVRAAAVPQPVPKPATPRHESTGTGRAVASVQPAAPAPSHSGKAAFMLDPPPGFGEKSFAAQRGALPMPARGRVTVAFGGTGDDGQPSRGWTIETRPRAQVIAPFEGRVVYAGPFRGYGLLLILEHGEGYHTLLAGMARIDSVPGQWLLAGEPVGVMGLPEDNQTSLYLELRRNGQPIDPDPWLAADNRKANG
jgi:septal ring factor EnvC (AmiA/AmiB activator)